MDLYLNYFLFIYFFLILPTLWIQFRLHCTLLRNGDTFPHSFIHLFIFILKEKQIKIMSLLALGVKLLLFTMLFLNVQIIFKSLNIFGR